ncbi:MAG: hypothetical protein Terrestrivirus7_10 [Terrestrivirus sp.]|uniref:Glycosyltransferase n=1 Tax=Terrestrivirus sp. TaxID=2487775 RepID=A0A3G4ZNL2_9VIRU|nr:MAG: hypothetical protein Terrestrivirus7_10 [Terrestrivirus sp.]
MKLLINDANYDTTINEATKLTGDYHNDVIFHCYWNGELNEKHLISIRSCYYFNVDKKEKRQIILWLEDNNPNKFNEEIIKYAEIKKFDWKTERLDTFMYNHDIKYHKNKLPSYSNIIRSLLLYKYGGCWFDLDVLFLRSFDPLFNNFENEIMLYRWEKQNYPNNAIYISLIPKNEKFKKNMEFIIERDKGWGFQQAKLTFDLELDMLIMPCSWFDGAWINNPYNLKFNDFFENTEKECTFENFFPGAFCYHWHNKWNVDIKEKSAIRQLDSIINKNMMNIMM